MFTLTALQLRFTCEALTPIRLNGYNAGSNLRGALGQVMTRAYCAGDAHDPAHVSTCPVHWLLAANEHPGEGRRGYALVLPRDTCQVSRDSARESSSPQNLTH